MDAAVRAYQSSVRTTSRDQLILDHVSSVRHILGRMLVTLPDNVDRENLEAAGILGLVEAAHHFDATRNVEFGAYACHRIKGAILDELRRNCPLPQHMLERWTKIRSVLSESDRPVSAEEIAVRCGLTETQIDECLDAVRLTRPEAWQEEFDLAGRQSAPEIEIHDRSDRLAAAIEQLDPRLRAIVGMYYRDELRLKEIGEVLNLSESRVSRLLQQAHLQLRGLLGASTDPGEEF